MPPNLAGNIRFDEKLKGIKNIVCYKLMFNGIFRVEIIALIIFIQQLIFELQNSLESND
ncbi:MAG: hypothetical protein FD143_586 [Ignavibacteria bacterium]|nr:MAG: hypothetical protein FD143_586 [Ignavibacteria bacterium]KAF0161657.1 MAG: hypothetical protein FD188_774 [Ignavibacteria bacterium]